MKNVAKVYFPNLDGLRFFAFLLVFLQHGFGNIFLKGFSDHFLIQKIIGFLFINGGTGVSVFFVLSGFLITYLIITEINLNGRLDLKAFYIRRTLRIWPLYFCVVFFAFDVYPFLKSFLGVYSDLCSRPIFYYFFLSNFDIININQLCPGKDSMMEGITWSVAIEEQFYLIWPLFFLLTPKKFFVYIFYTIIFISSIFRIIHVGETSVLYFHTLSVSGDLAIGGLGAYYVIYSKKFLAFFQNIRPGFIFLIYLLGFSFCVFGLDLHYDFLHVLERIISTLFYLFIILEQCFNSSSRFKMSKLKLISSAGKYTYGYYLLHPFAIMLVYNLYRVMGFRITNWIEILVSGIIALVITFFISYLSFTYFESYFIRLKSRFSYIHKT